MKINELLEIATKELKSICSRPKLEAEILLAHSLEKERIWIHVNYFVDVDTKKFFALLELRKNHIPIEYILGKVSFYSREFYINEGVLIPRPETELLIDKTSEEIAKNNYKNIAEIGTGSGIIAIMLALKHNNINITATDINEKAILLGKKNAKKFDVENKISFVKTSYIDGCKEEFDLLVSNPPYIANNFGLEKHLMHEPSNALFGGEKGDEIIKNIINISIEKNIKTIAIEMGYDQKKSLLSYLNQKNIKKVNFYKDLAGLDRGFVANISNTGTKND